MSDWNQRKFVLDNWKRIRGPILEIGSKWYGGTMQSNFRPDLPGREYVGTDLEEGRDVDVVCDITKTDEVRDRLGVSRFHTVICLSVLEHCWQPFWAAQNIASVMAPGGILFLSVPFVWRQHGFPNDFWRFTPAGVRVLFPDFQVDTSASYGTSKGANKKWPLTKLSLCPPKVGNISYSLFPMLVNMVLVKP